MLLNRGSATDVSFPSWQFNHAICFVPRAPEAGQPDDLWLDSTDSVTPFGFVPPGDYGRAGLVFGQDKRISRRWPTARARCRKSATPGNSPRTGKGGWRGTFHRTATGLADDGLRRAFRGLTPSQRGARLYGMLTDLWPSGDFTQGAVSDVSALHDGVELRAEVAAAGGDLPRLQSSGLEVFGSPTRDRPLWLNDGQPMSLAQTVQLRYAAPGDVPSPLPPPKRTEVGGQKMSVTWERVDDRTVRRAARLELLQPVVPAADYAALRQAIRHWNTALARIDARAITRPFPLFPSRTMTTTDTLTRPSFRHRRPTWNCCATCRRVISGSPPNWASASSARTRSSATCSSPSPCRGTS